MSTILAEDDLTVGLKVCVHSLKGTDQGASVMGQSMDITAVMLPFFVAKMISDPAEPIYTFDVRYLNLMRVTDEFVKAQRGGVGTAQVPVPKTQGGETISPV